jgi:hypothetical protein
MLQTGDNFDKLRRQSHPFVEKNQGYQQGVNKLVDNFRPHDPFTTRKCQCSPILNQYLCIS